MLGPMVNPANPQYQLVGVYSLEMARIYNYLLQQTGKPFTIIHGLDGYDEISLTNDTKVVTSKGENVLSAIEIGKRIVSPIDIYGGTTVDEAAKIFTRILKGEGTWAQNAVVLANAAMALNCSGDFKKYDDAYYAAVESLESGKAYQSFQKLISLQ
jgi:anthranilate phosphoribosyltransferase